MLSGDTVDNPLRQNKPKDTPSLETHLEPAEPLTTNNTELIMASAILLQAQKESHRNLPSFTGDFSHDVDEYIEKIESIGALTKESDEVLHILLKEKLSGQAERWYKDNKDSLITWSQLRTGFRERFQQPWLHQTLFTQLDNRKQDTHESVNDYYDAICRLCRRIDPKMSKQMILFFLQKGVRDDMKSNISRLMLTEDNPSPETFLKVAKIEEHVEQMNQPLDSTSSYLTQPQQNYMMTSIVNAQKYSDSLSSSGPIRRPQPASSQKQVNSSISPPTTKYYRDKTSQQYNNNNRSPQYPTPSSTLRPLMQVQTVRSPPCLICGRHNHSSIECHQRSPTGCFKCGHNGHHINECPQVFR